MNWNNNGSLIKAKTQQVRMQVDVVHNVQVRRIELGFSHEDLSFLLGKPKLYVCKIEAFLNNNEYYATDFAKLFEIFDCTAKELFKSESEPYQRCEIGIYQYKDDNGAKIHETYLFQKNKPLLLYRTLESIPHFKDLKFIKEDLTIEIRNLIEEGFFFEGAEASDIFQLCHQQMKRRFRPTHLKNLLHSLIKSVSPPLLRKITYNGRVTFVLL